VTRAARNAGYCRLAIFGLLAALPATSALALDTDRRLRSVVYSADEVYRLRGYAGYQIDLEFEPGESFVGLGAGDVQGLEFVAQGNHLFIKPKALHVHTNLTVLTSRRSYHFDYSASAERPDPASTDVVYVLRFVYAPSAPPAAPPANAVDSTLSGAGAAHTRNRDYWFCGQRSLQPVAAWDDGIHTHLQFDSRAELPAVFVRNDDGSESLLNFNVDRDEIVIHRIARRFVLRRGQLVGCIVNKGFAGAAASPDTGTIAVDVERSTRDNR
jgi:type IV secretion system protein VirB9